MHINAVFPKEVFLVGGILGEVQLAGLGGGAAVGLFHNIERAGVGAHVVSGFIGVILATAEYECHSK